MAVIFKGREIFFKLRRVVCWDILCIENSDKIALSCTVKVTEASLCLFASLARIRKFNLNDRHFAKNFWKLQKKSILLKYLRIDNCDKITLSCTVKEIEANLCFSIFGKNSKWPPFLIREIFFFFFGGGGEIVKSNLLRYLVVRMCQRNRSISHS